MVITRLTICLMAIGGTTTPIMGIMATTGTIAVTADGMTVATAMMAMAMGAGIAATGMTGDTLDETVGTGIMKVDADGKDAGMATVMRGVTGMAAGMIVGR